MRVFRYAFTNLDDVRASLFFSRWSTNCLNQISWGTKQDNVVETDLGAVIQDSNSRVDVEMLSEPSDVNQMYDEALSNLKLRRAHTKTQAGQTGAEKEQQTKDYYANVRTNVSSFNYDYLAYLILYTQVVLLWVLSNVSRPDCLYNAVLIEL